MWWKKQCGLVALVWSFSCSQTQEASRFAVHTDVFAAADIEQTNEFRGTPMALGDVVGDDLQDLVVGDRNGGLWVFENRGDLQFADVTSDFGLQLRSGVLAVAVVDLVGDSKPELLIASEGELLLLSSERPTRILARTPLAGLPEQILPIDVDGDGELEVLVLQRSVDEVGSLFHYEDGAFVLSTSHPIMLAGRPWSATFWDANGDGVPDLHVANDTLAADFGDGEPVGDTQDPRDVFFLGDADRSLIRQADAAGLGTPRSSMGGRVLDLDENQTLLFIPDLGRNKLFAWHGTGFEQVVGVGLDIAFFEKEPCNSSAQYECLMFSWSTAVADFNLDGAQELMVGNSFSSPVHPSILWYQWESQDEHFVRRKSEIELEAHGLLASDLDRDGDIDLVVSGRSGSPVLAENLYAGPACPRQLRLLGRRSHSEGRGATVTARYDEVVSQRHRIGVGGTAFVNDGVEIQFGRCDLTKIEVLWPSGLRSVVNAPDEGMLVVTEPE